MERGAARQRKAARARFEEGLEVVELDWPQRTSGILLREERLIGLNANHAPVRRRFSLAHELGHHFLKHHLWFEDNHEVTLDNPPLVC